MRVAYDRRRDTLTLVLGDEIVTEDHFQRKANLILGYSQRGALACVEILDITSLLGRALEEKLVHEDYINEQIPRNAGSSGATEGLTEVMPLEIELGVDLVRLAIPGRERTLLARLQCVRQEIASALGIVVTPIRVADNLSLRPSEYRIRLRSVAVARYELMPDHLLVMNPGNVKTRMDGIPTREPAFGLDALWVPKDRRNRAETSGYTVVCIFRVRPPRDFG